MPADEPRIRPAAVDDIPAIRRILAAHGNDGPITRVDIVGPYLRHLVEHHRVLVTELGGALVAFGAVAHAGVADHLADLFVVPDRLGQGLGRPLLGALFAGSERMTTFASDDPRALPSYVRVGMTPSWIQLYLGGDAAGLPPTHGVEVEGSDPAALAALELAWTGVDRAVDHAHWASQAEADPFVVVDDQGPLAFAYARARQISDLRVINRMLVRPGADPVGAIIVALRRAGGGGPVELLLPGPNPVLPVLLDHGFRMTNSDQFLASDPAIVDPARRLPNSGML